MGWRVWVAGVGTALILVMFGCATHPRLDAPAQAPAASGYVVLDPVALARGKAAAVSGEAAKAAAALVSDCNWALEQGSRSVVVPEKQTPSADPHDYVSLSTYLWPNPATPDGLPWITRDGEVNPAALTPDRDALEFVCTQSRLLALGYAVTGNQAYAAQAAALLRRFFLDPATRMNPNMNHAQMATGKDVGSPSGVIDARVLLLVVDVPALLAGSRALSPADTAGLRQWFADYLDWLLSSRNGVQAAQSANNQGTWYDAQVVGLALFTGRMDTARAQLLKAAARMDAQFDAEGLQPREAGRAKSLSLHIFNLEGWFTLALMGEKAGVDLWTLRSRSGRSLRQALDALRPVLRGDKAWPHEQIRELHTGELRQIAFLLRLAGLKFADAGFEKDLDHVVGSLVPGLLLNLTFPAARDREDK